MTAKYENPDEVVELVAGLKALSVLHRIKPNECAMLRKVADYIESQPAGTPFAWTTLCAVTAEPVFSTSPPDEPNVAEWRPLYFHPSRVDVALRRDTLCERLQQQCSDWGTYWRAPDAHGVNLSLEQAHELLRQALGVEVEIKSPADAAVERDATRYRWLRTHFKFANDSTREIWFDGDTLVDKPSELDESIDAALTAQQQESGS